MLRNENYDHIIDLHHNIRTARIKTGLKKPSSSFHKLNFEKWLMVQFKINRLPAKHIVDRYMETATHLGVKNDNQGLDFFIPVEKQIDIAVMFGFAPHSYVSIVIGAAHNTKCMTSSQISLLCDYLNKPVILLGGKQEAGKADEIIAKSNSKTIKSACGVLDIFQSGSVTKQSASFITHDTGLMHIAAALKKPQVVVWGNTIPEFGMYPYYGSHNINWHSFEIKGLRCRPCSKLGYAKCPRGHFRCMLDHDLVKIAEKAMEIIG